MQDLELALRDVRKAYRLVWAYQRKVMDLVQVISDEFETHDFYAWAPFATARPGQLSTNPMRHKWAWDALPFYKASFLYKGINASNQELKANDWLLEIMLDADDVDFDELGRGEPDAAKFPDAATTKSMLTLMAWKCTEDTSLNWYYGVWEKQEPPENDREVLVSSTPPLAATKMTFDLAQLGDRAAILSAVAEFKGHLRAAMQIDA